MLALLRKTRVVDDPGLDRPVLLDRRQYHLVHLRQHPFVRPASLADKMQQRLVLGCRPLRRRHGRQRLHALAAAGHHQAQAVSPKRPRSIGMAEHAHKPFNKGRKPPLALRHLRIHLQPRMLKSESLQITEAMAHKPCGFVTQLSDSVRLTACGKTMAWQATLSSVLS